jgi:hypothetical protein
LGNHDFIGVFVPNVVGIAGVNDWVGDGRSFVNAAEVLFLTVLFIRLKIDGSTGDQA